MPILRFTPGSTVPNGGLYVLVGHYGEATNVAVWCESGERLPLITVAADIGPFWYVQVDVANEQARVA
jgi:hypothetical protein